MTKGKILALMTDAFGGQGGISQYNRDLFFALARAGWAVHIVPRLAPNPVDTPDGVHQADPTFGRLAYSWTSLATALRFKPDIVLCGHIYMAPLGWAVARLVGAKYVLQTHGIEAWPNRTGLGRAAVEAADRVLTVSRYTRHKILEWFSGCPERLVVVANTVGERFTSGSPGDLRERLNLGDKKILLTVARMDPGQRYKGQDLVIGLLPGLVARGIDVVYVVGGEGGDRIRLESLAKESGVAERVKFIGAVPSAELVELYRTADLFVMPSSGEGFGIVYLEAMACGTPALGLFSAGAVDALADGELGTAVALPDLKDAIARCLQEPHMRGEPLSRAVTERFGRSVFEARIDAVFDALKAAA